MSRSFIFNFVIFYHFIIHFYCSFVLGAFCDLFNKRVLDWIGHRPCERQKDDRLSQTHNGIKLLIDEPHSQTDVNLSLAFSVRQLYDD